MYNFQITQCCVQHQSTINIYNNLRDKDIP